MQNHRKVWFKRYQIPIGTECETAKEIIERQSLNWRVSKQLVYTKFEGTFQEVPNKYAIVNESTGKPLGIVGDVYRPLQNTEAFSFFDAIVGSKDAHYVSAGAFDGGKKVFMIAKLNGQIQTAHDDVMDKYVILHNSHDGSSAVTIQLLALRLVCANGMLGLSSKGDHKIRHTISMGLGINRVRESLGILNEQFDILGALSKKMLITKFDASQMTDYLKAIGLIPKLAEEQVMSARAENILNAVLFNHRHGQGATPGTLWGAYNAVTEYLDWNGNRGMTKVKSNLFGQGATVKQSALKYAGEV